LDLALDDGGGSGMVPDLIAKQDKFKKDLNKISFNFETLQLTVPQGFNENLDALGETDENIGRDQTAMGQYLGEIQNNNLRRLENWFTIVVA